MRHSNDHIYLRHVSLHVLYKKIFARIRPRFQIRWRVPDSGQFFRFHNYSPHSALRECQLTMTLHFRHTLGPCRARFRHKIRRSRTSLACQDQRNRFPDTIKTLTCAPQTAICNIPHLWYGEPGETYLVLYEDECHLCNADYFNRLRLHKRPNLLPQERCQVPQSASLQCLAKIFCSCFHAHCYTFEITVLWWIRERTNTAISAPI
jgi:hypothetical protein